MVSYYLTMLIIFYGSLNDDSYWKCYDLQKLKKNAINMKYVKRLNFNPSIIQNNNCDDNLIIRKLFFRVLYPLPSIAVVPLDDVEIF